MYECERGNTCIDGGKPGPGGFMCVYMCVCERGTFGAHEDTVLQRGHAYVRSRRDCKYKNITTTSFYMMMNGTHASTRTVKGMTKNTMDS